MASPSNKLQRGKGQSNTDVSRRRVIAAISAPLGFFVLALLIVETFLASVLIAANLEKENKMCGIWLGVSLFVVVVVGVWVLVWFKPDNLVFDKDAILANRGVVPYGTEKKQVANPSLLTPTEPEEGKAKDA